MDVQGAFQALNGPQLVKLFLAFVLIAAFIFLRAKEAEGVMRGYVVVAFFSLARDLLYAFFPQPELYRASDLMLLALVSLAFALPFGLSWIPLAAAAFATLAGTLAWFLGFFGVAFPSLLLFLAALAPLAILFFYGRQPARGDEGQGLRLTRKSRWALAFASLAYAVAEALLGPASPWFQSLVVSLYYGAIFAVGFFFVDVLREELVDAVTYYEESVDSLFELFTTTGSVIKVGFSLQEVLDGMVGIAVDKTGADGGAILLAEDFEEAVAVRAVVGTFPPPFRLPESLPTDEETVAAHVRHARFKVGEGLLGELAREGSSLYIADASSDPRIPRQGDEPWLRLGSLIVAPLVARDQVIGLVAVARSGGEPFSERDFDRLKLLASFGAVSVSDAFTFLEAAERGDIDREAAIAEDIQKTVLPRELPELPGLSLGVFCKPLRGVCSDYYDVIPLRGGRVLVAFGDVAGKGVSAGLVMVMVRSILNLIVNSTKDAATLLDWVNRGLSGKVDQDHYSTLGLLIVDGASGEVDYANAAHQPLLLYRKASDSLETVEIKSIPIGVEKAAAYGSQRLRLEAGDVLVLHSDGVVEALNEQGRQYGRKSLGKALLRARERGAGEIAEAIRTDVEDFAGRAKRHDDQTVLVLKSRTRQRGAPTPWN